MKHCTYPCDSQPWDRTLMLPSSLMASGQAGHHRGHTAPVPSPTQPFLYSFPNYFSLLHIVNIQYLPSGTLLPPVAEIRDTAHS